MNGCNAMQTLFTEYLDGRLSGREMQRVAAHLESCRECAGDWKSLEEMQSVLATLGPVPEPQDLLLRIRVAISHERARQRRTAFYTLNLAWRNTVGPFLLQAAAGFASPCCCWARSSCWPACLPSRKARRLPRTNRWERHRSTISLSVQRRGQTTLSATSPPRS